MVSDTKFTKIRKKLQTEECECAFSSWFQNNQTLKTQNGGNENAKNDNIDGRFQLESSR